MHIFSWKQHKIILTYHMKVVFKKHAAVRFLVFFLQRNKCWFGNLFIEKVIIFKLQTKNL